MTKLPVIIAGLVAAVSCSLKEQAVEAVTISTDKAVVETGADALSPDTLKVTSTRSWSAEIKTEDGLGWVTISEKEHINAGEILETSPLVLTFSRYKGTNERTAVLTLHCAGSDKAVVIPVIQKGYKARIKIESIDKSTGIPAQGGDCKVRIESNTKWKARIDERSSTVIPTLSLAEGEDSREITLKFPANPNDELAKFAKLVVSATGCENAVLELVQTQSERFFFLSSEVSKDIAPYEESIFIPLRSNGPWTASVSECTFENGRMEPAEGQYSYSGINFRYDKHGEDPLSPAKHALVTIKREGMEDIKVEFSQKGSVHLNFGHYNPDYEWDGQQGEEEEMNYKPYTTVSKVFSQPSSFPYSYAAGTYGGIVTDCITSAGSFTFKMFGSDCGLYYVPGSYCFCIGKKQGDYVSFPAFEGYRLAEMYYEASCRNVTPYTVRDAEGNVIEGGEAVRTVRTVPISKEYNDLHHHIFPGTKAGQSYRMVLEETLRSISIKDLCLVYEKYE